MATGSPPPTHRQRVAHWVASLVYGVVVFAVIGSDGYFADPDTQVFAVAVAITCWAIGVVLLRRYLFRPGALEPGNRSEH